MMDMSKGDEKHKPVMGYPPMIPRYNENAHQQGYPSPYDNNLHPNGYIMPNQVYPNPNSYPNPSYNAPYYTNPSNDKYMSMSYMPMQEQVPGHSFGRFITTMMLVLIIGMIMISLVIWLLLGMEVPEFHVVSLQVPSLMIINSTIVGNWQVNVSMYNLNDNLDINVYQGKASIFYKTNLLAVTPIDTFNLVAGSSVIIFSNLTTSPGNYLDGSIITQVNNERSKGIVLFSLKISLGVQYSSKTEWKRQVIRVYCNDLEVRFGHGPEDKGELIAAENVECLIFG